MKPSGASTTDATPSNIEFRLETPVKGATSLDARPPIESGEGHGPRKELFSLIGTAATRDRGNPLHLPGAILSVKPSQDQDPSASPILMLRPGPNGPALPAATDFAGARLIVGSGRWLGATFIDLYSGWSSEEGGASLFGPALYLSCLAGADVAARTAAIAAAVAGGQVHLSRPTPPLLTWCVTAGGHVPRSGATAAGLESLRAVGAALALSPFNAAPLGGIVLPAAVARAVLPAALARTRAASDSGRDEAMLTLSSLRSVNFGNYSSGRSVDFRVASPGGGGRCVLTLVQHPGQALNQIASAAPVASIQFGKGVGCAWEQPARLTAAMGTRPKKASNRRLPNSSIILTDLPQRLSWLHGSMARARA